MTEGTDLLTIHCIPVEIEGFDVQVFFTKKVLSYKHRYQPVNERDITVVLCEYPDHRGVWKTTRVRPSFIASEVTQIQIKSALVNSLDATIQQEYSAYLEYEESSFCDHLYEWGYSEVDQLEYLN